MLKTWHKNLIKYTIYLIKNTDKSHLETSRPNENFAEPHPYNFTIDGCIIYTKIMNWGLIISCSSKMMWVITHQQQQPSWVKHPSMKLLFVNLLTNRTNLAQINQFKSDTTKQPRLIWWGFISATFNPNWTCWSQHLMASLFLAGESQYLTCSFLHPDHVMFFLLCTRHKRK